MTLSCLCRTGCYECEVQGWCTLMQRVATKAVGAKRCVPIIKSNEGTWYVNNHEWRWFMILIGLSNKEIQTIGSELIGKIPYPLDSSSPLHSKWSSHNGLRAHRIWATRSRNVRLECVCGQNGCWSWLHMNGKDWTCPSSPALYGFSAWRLRIHQW